MNYIDFFPWCPLYKVIFCDIVCTWYHELCWCLMPMILVKYDLIWYVAYLLFLYIFLMYFILLNVLKTHPFVVCVCPTWPCIWVITISLGYESWSEVYALSEYFVLFPSCYYGKIVHSNRWHWVGINFLYLSSILVNQICKTSVIFKC